MFDTITMRRGTIVNNVEKILSKISFKERNGQDTTKDIEEAVLSLMADIEIDDSIIDCHDEVKSFVKHGDFRNVLLRHKEFIENHLEELRSLDLDYMISAAYAKKHIRLISSALISLASTIGEEKFDSHTQVKTANYKCKRELSQIDIKDCGLKLYMKKCEKNIKIILREIARACRKDTLEAYDVLVADAYSAAGDMTHAEIYIKFHVL